MIKGVGHIGIYVSNIDQTLESLAKIVDFPPTMRKESEVAKRKIAVVDLQCEPGADPGLDRGWSHG